MVAAALARSYCSTDVSEIPMADLALALQLRQGTERLFDRHVRIDPVELEQVDAFAAKPAQATLGAFAQPFGASVDRPLIRTRSHEPGLGRNDDLAGVGGKSLPDDLFADVWPIGVGRVDEVDPALDHVAHQPHRSGPVGGRAPRRPVP